MRLRRAAIAVPAGKGVFFGALGGLLLVLAFTASGPQWDLLPLAFFLYSFPVLALAIAYLLAAFLNSRTRLVWRIVGGLLDAAPTLLISWAVIEEGNALSYWDNGPLVIAIGIAAIWSATLVPVVIALASAARLGAAASPRPSPSHAPGSSQSGPGSPGLRGR